MEEVEQILGKNKKEVEYDLKMVEDLLEIETAEDAIRYLSKDCKEDLISGSILKAFEKKNDCTNKKNWLNLNTSNETPYDDVVILFTEIMIGENFFFEIPKFLINSMLEAITLIRIHLKVVDINSDTIEYINSNWKKLDISILKNFIATTNTWSLVDKIADYAMEMNESENFLKLSELIWKFELYTLQIDWISFIKNLVRNNMISKISTLLHYKPDLMKDAISQLNTPQNAKYAAKIIESFQLNIRDYPEIIKYMELSALNFYLSNYFNYKDDQNFMPLWKIEDLLQGGDLIEQKTTLIVDLIENLAKKKNLHKNKMAKALAIRNGVLIPNMYTPPFANDLMVDYICEHGLLESNDFILKEGCGLSQKSWSNICDLILTQKDLEIDSVTDKFESLSDPKNDYICIPETTKVYFVDSDEDFYTNGRIKILKEKEILGIDCEWRPAITKYHGKGAALLQIGDKYDIFLIDLVALNNSQIMDEFFREIFTDPNIMIVGMDFKNDMKEIAKRFRNISVKDTNDYRFSFWSEIANFFDIYSIYKDLYGTSSGAKLSQMVENICGKKMCKCEQMWEYIIINNFSRFFMSNWERRPLRLSQEHYAALDAYILIDIFDHLKQELTLKGSNISDYSKHIIESKEETPQKNKHKSNKEQSSPQSETKPIKVHCGLKVIVSDSLKDSLPKSEFKFYGDSMMKNLINMLNQHGFDSVMCPVKLKRNQIYDDSVHFVKENRIFITKAPKIFKQYADKDSILVICQAPSGVIFEPYKQFNEVMIALNLSTRAKPTFQEITQIPSDTSSSNVIPEVISNLCKQY